jgi:hypothetical protein
MRQRLKKAIFRSVSASHDFGRAQSRGFNVPARTDRHGPGLESVPYPRYQALCSSFLPPESIAARALYSPGLASI